VVVTRVKVTAVQDRERLLAILHLFAEIPLLRQIEVEAVIIIGIGPGVPLALDTSRRWVVSKVIFAFSARLVTIAPHREWLLRTSRTHNRIDVPAERGIRIHDVLSPNENAKDPQCK
jgi:hypothetical protein